MRAPRPPTVPAPSPALAAAARRRPRCRAQNPFGAAKPREAVIAQKTGKTEEEVLKEEVSKEKLHVSAGAGVAPPPGRRLGHVPSTAEVQRACMRPLLQPAPMPWLPPVARPSHARPACPPAAPAQLRLSGAQLEEKRQAEAAIEEIKEVMGLEEAGSAKHAELATELAGRQQKLDDLMEEFAVRACMRVCVLCIRVCGAEGCMWLVA